MLNLKEKPNFGTSDLTLPGLIRKIENSSLGRVVLKNATYEHRHDLFSTTKYKCISLTDLMLERKGELLKIYDLISASNIPKAMIPLRPLNIVYDHQDSFQFYMQDGQLQEGPATNYEDTTLKFKLFDQEKELGWFRLYFLNGGAKNRR